MKQLDGSVGWGIRNSASDPNWVPHTNILVKGNYLSQYNTDIGCNTIYLCDVKGAVIEDNVCAGAGTSAIEAYYADDVIIQNNETYDTVQKAGGADSNGIDPDKGTTNIIIQYNYVHDNGDGILLCQIGFGGDAVIRYNILQNNSRYSLNLHSSSGASADIYNNVIYSDGGGSYLSASSGGSKYLDSYGTYLIRNNIFYSETSNPVIRDGNRVTYDSNVYYGITAPADSNGITSDPKLLNPGNGGSGTQSTGPILNQLNGYKLSSSSPCINSGIVATSTPMTDFYGNDIYNGYPDIGVHEYSEITYPDMPDETSIVVEAEVMTLNNYSKEVNSIASGSYNIKSSGTGTATSTFTGDSGNYSLVIHYFDENDGDASFDLKVDNTSILSWVSDQDLGSDAPTAQALTSKSVNSVYLNSGDQITITGTANKYDYARVDYMEIIPLDKVYEAEDMSLTNYSKESNTYASGDYCIKASGTGEANLTFDGVDGNYDLTINYFDENDGEAEFTVLLNNNTISSWTANQDLGSAAPDSSTLVSKTLKSISLNEGDIITIRGKADVYDYARVDNMLIVLN